MSAIKSQRKGKKKNPSGRSLGFVSKAVSLSDPLPNSLLWVPDNQIHEFVVAAESTGYMSSSTTLTTFNNVYFALSNFSNYSDFTTLFDQYRIMFAEIWLIPRSSYGSTNTTNYGLLTSVIDYDDSANFTTVAQALAYTNQVTSPGNYVHYHKFLPRFDIAAYGGAFTSYATTEQQWIDCGSSGVQHYGVKIAWTATDQIYQLDNILKIKVQFRNRRN